MGLWGTLLQCGGAWLGWSEAAIQLQAGCISPGSSTGRGSKGILWGPGAPGNASWVAELWMGGPSTARGLGTWGKGIQRRRETSCLQDPEKLGHCAKKGLHIMESWA